MKLHQKNLIVYNMDTMTDAEAESMGTIVHKAHAEYRQKKIEKNRKRMKRILDKRLKK